MDINSKDFLEKITSYVPTKRQLDILELGYYNFIHFGMNTFTNKEWGNGKTSPYKFKLKNLNTDQWCEVLKDSGSKGIVFTAKHHDGFCLFPSKYTDYSIANSSYKDGKGDIVKELSKSCKKYGLKLGLYLSPWDRHEKTYGTDAYNDYFCNQLEELLTNYGDLFCMWFDGACGEGPNGKVQTYDWSRIYKTIRTIQPNCVIANCGPDIRWIGNEAGKSRDSEWSVVPKRMQDFEEVAKKSQQEDNAKIMLKKIDVTDSNLGERSMLLEEDVDNLCYWPSEMDVPITKYGWFYHKWLELTQLRTVENLKDCYYNSVGKNATLILNVPPTKKGVISKKFAKRLLETKMSIENDFKALLSNKFNKLNDYEYVVEVKNKEVKSFVIQEDLSFGQRVEEFEIYIASKKVYTSTTIGFKKLVILENKINANIIKIKITKSRLEPHIKDIKTYTGI